MSPWLTGLILVASSGFTSANQPPFAIDIKGTSLAELMDLKITSLSRKQEDLNTAPAAVYVLTQDQILRMGVTHIAEALRYVPGVEVARLSASQWSISIRGFNSRSANKLLVMIDGRSIYSPLFSGVLWEEKDVMLRDVERIEVIRGPGGTQWGANAVNGVINIITKTAQATQGGVATIGIGLEERALVQSRYGWRLSENTHARVYGKFTRRDDSGTGSLLPNKDHSGQAQAGFRLDYREHFSQVTVQGDLYRGDIGPEYEGLTSPAEQYNGGNLQVGLSYDANPNRHHDFQVYYDTTTLHTSLIDRREIANVDYQLLQRWHNQEIVAGVGYKYLSDDVKGLPSFHIDPASRTDSIKSAFIQDDFAFLSDRVHLIVGTKYELNDYSGEEWQPNIRASYGFDRSVVWTAVSRAVRTPTRLEHDFVFGSLTGRQTLNPEYATVYEFGWRASWESAWQFDFATYLAKYDDLLTIETNSVGNAMEGEVTGAEFSVGYQAYSNWLLRLNYSYADMDLETAPDSTDVNSAAMASGSLPSNSLQLISLWDITERWQLNAYLRYVDELPGRGVPDYWVGDLSVVWRPARTTSLQLVGRHLGQEEHHEWGPAANGVEPDLAIYLTQEF